MTDKKKMAKENMAKDGKDDSDEWEPFPDEEPFTEVSRKGARNKGKRGFEPQDKHRDGKFKDKTHKSGFDSEPQVGKHRDKHNKDKREMGKHANGLKGAEWFKAARRPPQGDMGREKPRPKMLQPTDADRVVKIVQAQGKPGVDKRSEQANDGKKRRAVEIESTGTSSDSSESEVLV